MFNYMTPLSGVDVDEALTRCGGGVRMSVWSPWRGTRRVHAACGGWCKFVLQSRLIARSRRVGGGGARPSSPRPCNCTPTRHYRMCMYTRMHTHTHARTLARSTFEAEGHDLESLLYACTPSC